MLKTSLIYGGIAGAIVTAFMLSVSFYAKDNYANFDKMEVWGYVSFLIAFSAYYFGMQAYKKNFPAEPFHYWHAVQLGAFMTLVTSAMYVLAWVIYFKNIDPEFMEKYIAFELEKLTATGASAAEIQAKADEMSSMQNWYKNDLLMALMTFAEIMPLGLIVSFILAIFGKRKNTYTA